MTDTVFISSSNALGSFWTSKRYFDYLIDETSLPLLRGREFGQAVLICPSLWEGRRAIRRNEEAFISHVRQLIDILHEVKIERLTYVTSIDTQPETGNEDSPLVHEFEDAFLSALAELRDYVNLKFGRVLSVYLPEVTGTGADMSVADLLANAPEGKGELIPCAASSMMWRKHGNAAFLPSIWFRNPSLPLNWRKHAFPPSWGAFR